MASPRRRWSTIDSSRGGCISIPIGLLPSPAQLQAFLADHAPDKRERLVATLLADERRYAEHWLTFWNELLRNDYRGTGFIDGGRQADQPTGCTPRSSKTCPTTVRRRADQPGAGRARVHQGHRLARRGQRQPDAADAGGAEHLAGVHGREPQVRVLPRQLHQRLAAGRRLRPRRRSTPTSRWRWSSATSRPARRRR